MCLDQGITHDDELLSVGENAELSSVTVRTLQYSDHIGLLPAERKADGKRGYTSALVQRLHQIRLMQEMGMNLEQIQTLLDKHQDTQLWQSASHAINGEEPHAVSARYWLLYRQNRVVI